MGLLVAGITGGASLIKIAQLRSVVTESETYRAAVYTYYSQFGVMPGIRNGDMLPVNFWGDLKANNIVDKVVSSDDDYGSYGVASKFRGAYWYTEDVTQNHPDSGIASSTGILYEFINLNILYISGHVESLLKRPFVPNDAKSIDEKIDDGVYNTGYVRGVQTATRNGTFDYGSSSNLTNYSLIIKLDF
jgi:hypothetical protein